jgi:UDP-2,3-diacylglucosamine pyrophosphatase LpxH
LQSGARSFTRKGNQLEQAEFFKNRAVADRAGQRFLQPHRQEEGKLMERSKIVVISDVHLSDEQSWSWFNRQSGERLTGFLQQTANDSTVRELVLLGDIFELWLFPISEMPWTAARIIQHWDSGPNSVIAALRECADKLPQVSCLCGNHDMGVTQADLNLISPKIRLISADVHHAGHPGVLHLEHGHAVDLFNAPDISGDPIEGLPFGYFVTRLVASAGGGNEVWRAVSQRIEAEFSALFSFSRLSRRTGFGSVNLFGFDFFLEHVAAAAGASLIKGIVDVLLWYVKLVNPSVNENSRILLPSGGGVTIGEVKRHYHRLLVRWFRLHGLDGLYKTALASTDLDWRAQQLLSEGTVKIVVTGHTHQGKILPAGQGRYANSGSWRDGVGATYLEIIAQPGPAVSLKAYPSNASVPPLSPAATAAASSAPPLPARQKKPER